MAIQSRSMMEILGELAAYIDVPAAQVAEQSAIPTMVEEEAIATDIPPLIQVKSGREEPDDTFAAVRYRDYWFWIDHRDLKSKRVFSFLMFLFFSGGVWNPKTKTGWYHSRRVMAPLGAIDSRS